MVARPSPSDSSGDFPERRSALQIVHVLVGRAALGDVDPQPNQMAPWQRRRIILERRARMQHCAAAVPRWVPMPQGSRVSSASLYFSRDSPRRITAPRPWPSSSATSASSRFSPGASKISRVIASIGRCRVCFSNRSATRSKPSAAAHTIPRRSRRTVKELSLLRPWRVIGAKLRALARFCFPRRGEV